MDQQQAVTKADLENVVLQLQGNIEAAVAQAQQANKADIEAAVAQAEQANKAGIESVSLLVQQMTERMVHRFEEFEKRFEARFLAMQSRQDRTNDSLVPAMGQIAAFGR